MLMFSLLELSLKFINLLVLPLLLCSKNLVLDLLDFELKFVDVVLTHKLVPIPVKHLERSEAGSADLRGIVISD
jgi:hypothetical protein